MHAGPIASKFLLSPHCNNLYLQVTACMNYMTWLVQFHFSCKMSIKFRCEFCLLKFFAIQTSFWTIQTLLWAFDFACMSTFSLSILTLFGSNFINSKKQIQPDEALSSNCCFKLLNWLWLLSTRRIWKILCSPLPFIVPQLLHFSHPLLTSSVHP